MLAWQNKFEIIPAPGATPHKFVDREASGRSGHCGHAMFQRPNGDIVAFLANCTGTDLGGHSAVGWMEYCVSSDGSATWSDSKPLPISKAYADNGGGRTLFAEKAIAMPNGRTVLTLLVSDISGDPIWEPYHVPMVITSDDHGETWSEPVEVGTERGRIYSAAYREGEVLLLKFDNDAITDFCGSKPWHKYKLFFSKDGLTFSEKSIIPFDTTRRGYGTICVRADGSLIVYVYNKDDEFNFDYCVSSDGGKTWSDPAKTRFAQRLRNPQMVRFGDTYFMHGRSGGYGPDAEVGHFIVYSSPDGVNWDEGTILARREHGSGAYSNSIVVQRKDGPPFLLIHASHAYSEHRTNTLEWRIERKPAAAGRG